MPCLCFTCPYITPYLVVVALYEHVDNVEEISLLDAQYSPTTICTIWCATPSLLWFLNVWTQGGKLSQYDRSLFQRLEANDHPVQLLDVQYRMHPTISAFPRCDLFSGDLFFPQRRSVSRGSFFGPARFFR